MEETRPVSPKKITSKYYLMEKKKQIKQQLIKFPIFIMEKGLDKSYFQSKLFPYSAH